MTIEVVTNGIVLAGVVVVFAVITGGALVARQPSGRLIGRAMWFELLSGWRGIGVAVIGWLAVAGLTIFL